MGAKSGREFLQRLDSTPREVWYGDEKITGSVSKHPAFRGVAKSIAALYDMQLKPELEDVMTYESPTTHERVGTSFLQPRTREELGRRTAMIKTWADFSGGMMGRTADYLNSSIMAMAAAAQFFGKGEHDFAANVSGYYEYVRENDLVLTHTLINPQTNRGVGPSKQADPFIAARVADKTSEGVVIRGARMLATLPIADEIMVFPSTVIRSGQDDMPYSIAFAVPVSAKGLKFVCRESFAAESAFDHPLASRFDEQDAVVVFDDVLVPWERVFILEDPDRANKVNESTGAIVFMAHQATVREAAKAEFMAGLATMVAETIGADAFPQVQERIAGVLLIAETMKAFIGSSEARAKTNEWGLMSPDYAPLNAARNVWPRLAPDFSAVIKQTGASGLMAIPPEGILGSEARPDVDRYFQSKLADGEERVRLFKMAWDASGSSFGGRQDLYERFFFGDPVRMASAYYSWYDKEPYKRRVMELLHRKD
ncbi:MAG: 4-hydroxyphenylacetate 3-monooxygenase, oxygenase component [Nitrososphaerota archaeon]|jgi:4-hydroxyphenylacetate 3-monooxygenase|nr:4-hydroxyphenylacetate 3-monooxygenase, oxygenase component [Nitrososphaerota archaeon]MDG6941766.1 4-hydroxyphenylacetate 3-monooxygenase, oxygenase component [Nitrososphaerota archaeon]MDG6947061.1 4-hydroxyphenylacetate 3-monooxygenase, oxygenase component [Nitrososphaerota archaeon]MDG6950527.1 4-hydroxyphenylacetate 3-monooxygenase, oxygenase component [Nitrososphaerota archaeon]